MSAGLINSSVAVFTLAGLAWLLYRPKVQESGTYKATVVPLGEIMDVGFIVFSPVIILLFGYDATWAMLGLCLLAILTCFAISYNIKNYEPLIGKPDPLHRWNSIALWALLAASVVNVAYYAQLLMTLVWLPLDDLYSPGLVTATAAGAARHPSDLRIRKGPDGAQRPGQQDHGLQPGGDRRGPRRLRHLQRPAADRRPLRFASLQRRRQ
jgi:hypothetical protein